MTDERYAFWLDFKRWLSAVTNRISMSLEPHSTSPFDITYHSSVADMWANRSLHPKSTGAPKRGARAPECAL